MTAFLEFAIDQDVSVGGEFPASAPIPDRGVTAPRKGRRLLKSAKLLDHVGGRLQHHDADHNRQSVDLQAQPNVVGTKNNLDALFPALGDRVHKMKYPVHSQRLRHLRAVMGAQYGCPSQVGFANFLGIEQTRYSNYENGRRLSHDAAVMICQRIPGMTLDWLYFGNPNGLPVSLAQALGVLNRPGNASTAFS